MKSRNTIFLLIIFCITTFFVNRSALPTDIMESRNIVTAREIVSDGNWLLPTMNGELRLEKPPLPTWVAGLMEMVAPNNLSVQRFAPAVMGLIWTLFLFLTAKYLTRRNDFAVNTVLVFLTLYNVVLMGRSATWDIYCHSFMMGAIYFFLRGFYDDDHGFYEEDQGFYYEGPLHTHKWRWFLLAGLFMGLSFESKGPVSFYALLLPFILTVILLRKPRMKGKWGPLCVSILICLVLGGWWYIYLLTYHPEATEYVIHKESAAWSGHNVRPWYYYWRFFLEGGLWAPFILAALVIPFWRKRISQPKKYVSVVVWMLLQLVLLSCMPEKKMRYLLPMAPTVAMSVAFVLVWLETQSKHRKLSQGFVWIYAGIFFIAELFFLRPVGKLFGNPNEHSINEVCTMSNLDHVPFYHNEKEELRIELVYETRRKILPLDLNNVTKVMGSLPCVIVSQKPLTDEMPLTILNKLDTVSIGYFDDNKHPRKDSHYSSLFLNHVTLLKVKKNKILKKDISVRSKVNKSMKKEKK